MINGRNKCVRELVFPSACSPLQTKKLTMAQVQQGNTYSVPQPQGYQAQTYQQPYPSQNTQLSAASTAPKVTKDGVPIVNWGKQSVKVKCPKCGVDPTTTICNWTQSGANWGIVSICPCFLWFGETDTVPAVDDSRGYKHMCIHCNEIIGFYPSNTI
jgi:hypothetical protein